MGYLEGNGRLQSVYASAISSDSEDMQSIVNLYRYARAGEIHAGVAEKLIAICPPSCHSTLSLMSQGLSPGNDSLEEFLDNALEFHNMPSDAEQAAAFETDGIVDVGPAQAPLLDKFRQIEDDGWLRTVFELFLEDKVQEVTLYRAKDGSTEVKLRPRKGS